MRSGKITFFLLILAVVLVIAVFGIVWRPSLTREASAPSFQPAEIERGAQLLAAIGNCVTSHQAGRCALWRRTADRDALRHDLFH